MCFSVSLCVCEARHARRADTAPLVSTQRRAIKRVYVICRPSLLGIAVRRVLPVGERPQAGWLSRAASVAMPIKKKEEVCGKPTQYNLQTCEYDWKYLPDTHFVIKQGVRRRERPSLWPSAPASVARSTPRAPSPQESPPRERPLAAATPPSPAPPLVASPAAATQGPQFPLVPWSHEELRQMVYANQSEAQRSYLRSGA
ncbi:uncharacterized protein Tco025E_08113 [Trypanosoma conorhini]|uniref:Uncharacterized protein n=1 Tax=Trypanosoma conorhini TaxID=83891 RepID=A0A3R7KYC0_9TRYP|nr:uncharacterized protein Tco025E_08113 [Trypanosoma conorhini]RNF03770.1 hypothetical protein Tco025E_08113 [Trypanosoma conorhini]